MKRLSKKKDVVSNNQLKISTFFTKLKDVEVPKDSVRNVPTEEVIIESDLQKDGHKSLQCRPPLKETRNTNQPEHDRNGSSNQKKARRNDFEAPEQPSKKQKLLDENIPEIIPPTPPCAKQKKRLARLSHISKSFTRKRHINLSDQSVKCISMIASGKPDQSNASLQSCSKDEDLMDDLSILDASIQDIDNLECDAKGAKQGINSSTLSSKEVAKERTDPFAHKSRLAQRKACLTLKPTKLTSHDIKVIFKKDNDVNVAGSYRKCTISKNTNVDIESSIPVTENVSEKVEKGRCKISESQEDSDKGNCKQKCISNIADYNQQELTNIEKENSSNDIEPSPITKIADKPSEDSKDVFKGIVNKSWTADLHVKTVSSVDNSDCILANNDNKNAALQTKLNTLEDKDMLLLENCDNGSDITMNSNKKIQDDLLNDDCMDKSVALFEDWEVDDFHAEEWTGEELGECLQLDKPQYCKVLDLKFNNEQQEVLLTLQSIKDDSKAICVLRGYWIHSRIQAGDIVSIRCDSMLKEGNRWIIDNNGGLLVEQPNILVSGTAVVGSLFCRRKGVLSDKYKGLDPDSPIMVIGSLVHQLLQEVLKNEITEVADIEKVSHSMLKREDVVHMLYSSSMTVEGAMEEIQKYIPQIEYFIKKYVKGLNVHNKFQQRDENWGGQILDIQDIEENIWSPHLGIKGKVDVSVEVKIHNHDRRRRFKKVMPLELKTGKSSFSAEHRGQVILYSMMMAELGDDPEGGLLLYLRDGSLREIPVGHRECRDLILLRNELAYFLTRSPATAVRGNHVPELPEPVSHQRACSRCPYQVICSTFLSLDGLDKLSSNHPMAKIVPQAISHLSESHVNYFTKWSHLLELEEIEKKKPVSMKEIWFSTPEEREKKRKCLSNLTLGTKVVESESGKFSYMQTFVASAKRDLRETELSPGDYVIISTDSRIAVAAGIVKIISSDSVTIFLDRDVSKGRSSCVFHVDAYESHAFLSFNLTNLGCLLDTTSDAERLRRLIIDRETPTFQKMAKTIIIKGKEMLQQLNKVQQRAVIQALAAKDYLLIKGMPGTGKTAVIVVLVKLFVQLGQSVLLTSHTHMAVDNILLRLQGKVDFLRLGSLSRIHPGLHSKSEAVLTAGCKTPEDLKAAYNNKAVVATTCLGSSHPLFTHRKFDVCIVDESTQVLQPSVLRPLFSARKFVLIGDPEQLPPVVQSRKARELGIQETLFNRLDAPETTVALVLQYRMNQAITILANALTYNNQLQCGTEEVAQATLSMPKIKDVHNLYKSESWVLKSLSTDLDQSVLFIDIGNNCMNGTNKGDGKISNVKEAAVLLYLIRVLKEGGVPMSQVGIISPFRAQVALVKKLLVDDRYPKDVTDDCDNKKPTEVDLSEVEVNTVDQYQGRDKEVIIYSCTKSIKFDDTTNCEVKDGEILSDKRRLTVAITRAKHKLIVIGDRKTLQRYVPFQQLLSSLPTSNILQLENGVLGFDWTKVLDGMHHLTQ